MAMNDCPNILFILTDQQRYDTLAAYGNDWIQTPNLNALAEHSFVFEHAYVTQPVCSPSRSTILTGLYPHTTGVVRNAIPLRPDTPTIAELVPEHYRRAYFGKWHLGDDRRAQHGWDQWLHVEDLGVGGNTQEDDQQSPYHRYLSSNGIALPDLHVRPGGDPAGSQRSVAMANLPEAFTQAAFIGDRAAEFLLEHPRNLRASEPFFLFVNFFEPHPPYSSPLGGLYDPATLPVGPAFLERPQGASLFHTSRADFFMAGKHRADSVAGCDGHNLTTEAGWRRLRAQYYGNVTLVDRQVGKIMSALEKSGLSDRTIVVFTSDHGDMIGDHGLLEKRTLYEESVRIPLLFRIPWLNREQTFVPGNFSQVDLVPTLLELIGLTVPDRLQGRSRADAFTDATSLTDNGVFIEWYGRGDRDLGNPTINEMIAIPRRCIISADRWKLNLCVGDEGELFDLNSDPYERTNLFPDPRYRRHVGELAASLRGWQKQTGDATPLPSL